MLSDEDEQTLAAMEAGLRAESPELHAMFEHGSHPSAGLGLPPGADEAAGGERPSAARRVLRILAAAVAATAATALTTLALGPELGGLVGALAFPAVGLYGWSQLGCPGHGRR